MKNLFNSKKTLLLIVGLLLFAFTLSAQQQKGGESRNSGSKDGRKLVPEQVNRMVDEIDEELSLTYDQIVKVTKLFKNHMKDVNILQEDKSSDGNEKKALMASLRKGFGKKVNSLLTPEQQRLFKEMHKNRG